MLMLEVTENNIANGKPRNPCQCPLALAFLARYPTLQCYINADGIEIGNNVGDYLDIGISDQAIYFMDCFDDGMPVEAGLIPLFDDEGIDLNEFATRS